MVLIANNKHYMLHHKVRKYYKEVTEGDTYECFMSGYDYYIYVKTPYSVGDYGYNSKDGSKVSSVNELTLSSFEQIISINSDGSINYGLASLPIGYTRYPSGDLSNTTTQKIEVSPNEDYDYYEEDVKKYLFARGERKYYKYNYTNWTQPTMTSDTTYGTLTASVVNSGSGVYQAFDKNTSSWWEAKTGTAEWLNWKLPVTLKITGIKIRVRTGNRPNITCRCYTDSSKKTPIGDSITTITAGQEIAVANIPSSGIITDNIYFDCSSTQDYMGILEITITAQEQSSVESTIDDYDYYEYESFKLY